MSRNDRRRALERRRLSEEWRDMVARFRTFIADNTPTPADRRAALGAAYDVAGLLSRRFLKLGTDGLPGHGGYRIIGGLANDTSLRPARTVDLLFHLPDRLCRQADDGAHLAALILCVRDTIRVLEARYGAVQTSREGWLAVTTGTGADGRQIAVRVIPCCACAGGFRLATTAPHPRHHWHILHPDALMSRINAADRRGDGKARHLIRMAKAWRRHRQVPIGAFALEVAVCAYLDVWTYQRQSALFYDWMLRDFFFWLTAQASAELPLPGADTAMALGTAWLPQAWVAYAVAAEASEYERDNRDIEAVARWQRLFGRGFGRIDATALPATAGPAPAGSVMIS